MVRLDGIDHIQHPENVGKCYWCFDNWKDKSNRKKIEEILIKIEEKEYLKYLKKQG
jgi:hypothetical protein